MKAGIENTKRWYWPWILAFKAAGCSGRALSKWREGPAFCECPAVDHIKFLFALCGRVCLALRVVQMISLFSSKQQTVWDAILPCRLFVLVGGCHFNGMFLLAGADASEYDG